MAVVRAGDVVGPARRPSAPPPAHRPRGCQEDVTMAKKILLPVFPSDRFYEAVIRAGDIVGEEGGLVTFAFTRVRPSPEKYAESGDGQANELDVEVEAGNFDGRDLEEWRQGQVSGLDEARRLLYERGVSDGQIDYLFADEA